MKQGSHLDISQDKVLLIQGGEVVEVEAPKSGYGELRVVWVHNVITQYDKKETNKMK